MTVEKFDELVKNDKELRERLSAEISALMEEEARLDAEMIAAAEVGNEALFKSLKAKKTDAEDSIFVKRAFLDKLKAPVDEAAARDAWSDFVKAHDKRMTKAIEAFAAEKEKFLQMYSDMIDLQKDACAVRERLGSAVGLPASSFGMVTIPVQSGANIKGALKLGNVDIHDPDAVYFLSCYAQKTGAQLVFFDGSTPIDPEYARVKTVVANRKAKDSFFGF